MLLFNLFHHEALEDVAFLDVVVLFNRHAALIACGDLLDGVLEALQRAELSFVNDNVVAQDADRCVARDFAVFDIAACDRADGRDLVGLADLGVTDDCLAELGREQALHGVGDFVDGVVDDAVHPHVDLVALCSRLRLIVRADVEADDNRVGGRSQQDIGLVDCADARVDDLDADLVVRNLLQRRLDCLCRVSAL